jgi:hypothetical protein
MTDRHGGQGAQPVVGERHLAAGERDQDGRDVRLVEPEDAAARAAHRTDGVGERDQLGSDAAGAVIEQVDQPVTQHAPAASADLFLPAFLAVAPADEVAQAAGAVAA